MVILLPCLYHLEFAMLVFLDLEETVIDNWENGWLLPAKIAIIKEMLSEVTPTIGLMSWAVWDDKDKEKFNETLRPELENALGFKFDDRFLWSMNDWADQLFKFHGKVFSRQDLFDCFGKHEVLFMVSRCHPEFKGKRVALFDDTVEHCLNWNSQNNQCSVVMQNINELAKVW